jgi:D-alanine-D-alanine ligase-like ATP-grasp enzyme
VVKAASAGPREHAEVPEPIVAARRRLGLDYAKLDFVIHDGEPVLLDVNRTPTFAGHALTPAQRRLAEWLADGIPC